MNDKILPKYMKNRILTPRTGELMGNAQIYVSVIRRYDEEAVTHTLYVRHTVRE